jgi:hypothetical protein
VGANPAEWLVAGSAIYAEWWIGKGLPFDSSILSSGIATTLLKFARRNRSQPKSR